MKNILLILQREYLQKVKNKTFLVMTIVGPLLFAGMIGLTAWLAVSSTETKVIEIQDDSGLFSGKFPDTQSMRFHYLPSLPLEASKARFQKNKNYALLYIPKITPDSTKGIQLFFESSPNLEVESRVVSIIEKELENIKLRKSGIDPAILAQMKVDIDLSTKVLNEKTEKESSSEAAMAAGYGGAFLIYMFIFMYGVQVLRGVQEEKTNRIVEVMISSVKPFELMMGKIMGIALVGLTQFMLWIVFSYLLSLGVGSAISDKTDVFAILGTINVPVILACFLFYFITGYLLYGALFAAIGAAVDNDTDVQQFMFPVTIPLVVSFIAAQMILREPGSAVALWMSLIPFTAPIVMMVRIPFEPPVWQIALSMVSMILGFLATTWLAARIYRVGILMYGKKVNYKELSKWLFYKG